MSGTGNSTEAESLFGGRVTRGRLAVVSPPFGPEAPALKRLLLPQGELAQFHNSDVAVHYMAMIQLQTGTVRGNHYHKQKLEWIYLIDGCYELLLSEGGTEKTAMLTVEAGDLVCIQPGIIHALRVKADGHAIEYSPNRHDPADTFRHPLC